MYYVRKIKGGKNVKYLSYGKYGILIGIRARTFKVRSDKKAVCILECLGVQVQEQSWWVLRYN